MSQRHVARSDAALLAAIRAELAVPLPGLPPPAHRLRAVACGTFGGGRA